MSMATIAGVSVRRGETLHRIKDDVPRVVVLVDDSGIVWLRAPGGSNSWPVIHVARHYYRKAAS